MRTPLPALLLAAACQDAPGDDATSAVRINELLASNQAATERDDGAFPDWIELVNTGDVDVPLAGVTITDDLALPRKAVLPPDAVLPAGGYLLLWADGVGARGDALPFRLTSAGEELGLFGRDDTPWDTLTFPAQTTDVAWARSPDGDGAFAADPTPTPGAPND